MAEQDKGRPMSIVYVKHPGPEDDSGIPVAGLSPLEEESRFLAGRLYFGEDHWLDGRPVKIALDEVAYLIEFDSVEEYRKVIDGFRNEEKRPGFIVAPPRAE